MQSANNFFSARVNKKNTRRKPRNIEKHWKTNRPIVKGLNMTCLEAPAEPCPIAAIAADSLYRLDVNVNLRNALDALDALDWLPCWRSPSKPNMGTDDIADSCCSDFSYPILCFNLTQKTRCESSGSEDQIGNLPVASYVSWDGETEVDTLQILCQWCLHCTCFDSRMQRLISHAAAEKRQKRAWGTQGSRQLAQGRSS